MATAPARQLNSKTIRSAIVSKVIPIVQGTCSIISAKNTYSASDNNSVDDLWLQICPKRDECDEAVKKIKGVAFFFSSISVLERKKKAEQRSDEELEEEENDEENSNRQKCFWPAISYWIATQSRNGMRVSTVPFHSALLETGLQVTATSLPECKPGREEQSASPLCTTVKDHNNYFLQRKVDRSFEHGIELLRDQILDEPTVADVQGTERVVRLQVVSTNFSALMQEKAIPALVRAGLQLDVFGIECASSNEPKLTKVLASPIVVLLNDVDTAMAKLGYALHEGEVFKRCSKAKYSYAHCCSVKKFLSLLSHNDYFKDRLIMHFSKLESILCDPECEFTKQLKIAYDLIEVSDAWCFSISQRRFLDGAIKDTEVGKVSPRAFVPFDHAKDPDPGYFREILENSLSPTDIAYFCEYYVRLLNHGIKQHKEKVLCLIGEPNSGKTSLFTPITKIIPPRYIAMITKQRAFNKSLIDKNTEVIFLDEAYAKLLDPDDWKVLAQGGLTAHDRKYRSSSPVIIRCPMFITCQQEMNFGEGHNAAMDARLRKFHFKALTSPPVAGVQRWLKDHAIDCLVWASNVAVTPIDELPAPVPGTAYEENQIDDDERERIRNLTMDDSEGEDANDSSQNISPEMVTQHTDGDDDEDEDDGDVNSGLTYSDSLEKSLDEIAVLRNEQPRHSLKHRQLELLGAGVRRFIDDCDCRAAQGRTRLLEETRARWISIGMMREEDAHLLTAVGGTHHPNIERSRKLYFAKKKDEMKRALLEKAHHYYDDWVLGKEKELWDLQRQEEAATETDTKRAISYLIGVAVDALRLNYQRDAIPGLDEHVLEERKKKVVEMGLISSQQAETLRSIWEPLPWPLPLVLENARQEQIQGNDEGTEALFLTPLTTPSASTSQTEDREGSHSDYMIHRSQKRRHGKKKKAEQLPKKARITNYFSYSQE